MMSARGLVVAICILTSLGAGVPDANGQAFPDQRDSLKGLTGVWVSVDTVEKDAEQKGLTQFALQTDVELRLREKGVRVFSERPGPPASLVVGPKQGVIAVSVNTKQTRHAPGAFVFNVSLQLRQSVLTQGAQETLASTWDSGSLVGTVGSERVEDLRNGVRDLVDEFTNDWLAVNPK